MLCVFLCPAKRRHRCHHRRCRGPNSHSNYHCRCAALSPTVSVLCHCPERTPAMCVLCCQMSFAEVRAAVLSFIEHTHSTLLISTDVTAPQTVQFIGHDSVRNVPRSQPFVVSATVPP